MVKGGWRPERIIRRIHGMLSVWFVTVIHATRSIDKTHKRDYCSGESIVIRYYHIFISCRCSIQAHRWPLASNVYMPVNRRHRQTWQTQSKTSVGTVWVFASPVVRPQHTKHQLNRLDESIFATIAKMHKARCCCFVVSIATAAQHHRHACTDTTTTGRPNERKSIRRQNSSRRVAANWKWSLWKVLFVAKYYTDIIALEWIDN